MTRWFRRLVLMMIVGGAVGGVLVRRARTTPRPTAAPPSWPPLDIDAAAAVVQTLVDVDLAPPDDARWVLPVEDGCPPGYPVKANDSSRIFHVPGGRFYDRTKPERCYADAVDAVADGYRAAKA